MAKKRLVRGKDWHAWAWKATQNWSRPGELLYWAEPFKPKDSFPTGKGMGKWVRVKFAEV